MAYYPKSQVKTSLYTNGGEYVLITTRANYKGYYFLTSTGKRYVGKIPTNGPSIEIIPIEENINSSPQASSPFTSGRRNIPQKTNTQQNRISSPIISENPLTNIKVSEDISIGDYVPSYNPPPQVYINRQIPTFSLTIPTQQNFENGYFTRYFSKKNNELKYIEISKDDYTKLLNQDKDMAWDLYSPSSIKWQLTGESSQVYSSNLASVSYVENTQNWVGFSQYFKNNFLKYFV